MAVNQPASLEQALQIEYWMHELEQEALPQDIFATLSDNFTYIPNARAIKLPNAVFLRIEGAEANAAHEITIPMIKELSGPPSHMSANGDPTLMEEDWIVKHTTMQYNELSKCVTNQKYGLEWHDRDPYKIQEYRSIGIGKWYNQYMGRERRRVLLEGQTENLHEYPHFLPQSWSMNWYVPNLADQSQPVYSTNYATHTGNIVEALLSAGTGQNAAGTVTYFQRLADWAAYEAPRTIVPYDFEDGTQGYIVALPTPTARWMKNSTTGFPTLGSLWTTTGMMPDAAKLSYPNLIGQLGPLRFIEDPRYATLLPGGSGSAGGAGSTLTAAYRGMGQNDDGSSDPRDKSANRRIVGWLLGRHACMEWPAEAFHWEWEYMIYDKYFGSGVFCGWSAKQPIFSITGGTAANMQQNSSIVLPFSEPPWVA